ncbi:MAG: hypothetical protein O3A94_05535 [Proteobacteria bacterium]|nr:hypothetical protein [Pseudomonadota bacterium]
MAESGWNLGEWLRLDQKPDGMTTITDFWLLSGKIFHLPGDAIIIGLAEHMPKVAIFLELSGDSLGEFGSGVISFFVWMFLSAAYFSALGD